MCTVHVYRITHDMYSYVYRMNYSLYTYMVHILVRVTVPGALVIVVFEAECTVHWKVVVPLIKNTVNEYLKGVVGLFS